MLGYASTVSGLAAKELEGRLGGSGGLETSAEVELMVDGPSGIRYVRLGPEMASTLPVPLPGPVVLHATPLLPGMFWDGTLSVLPFPPFYQVPLRINFNFL